MLEFYKKELALVEAAILKIEADPQMSQSVSSANGGSFSASYVELTKLHRRHDELIHKIAQLGADGRIGVTYPIYCGG